MIKIRSGIHETNSSSSHALCITKRNVRIKTEDLLYRTEDGEYNYGPDAIYIRNGVWDIDDDVAEGFGWGFEILHSFEDKFKYALCSFCGGYDDYTWLGEQQEKLDMLIDIAKKYIPGLKEVKINTHDVNIYLDKKGNELFRNEMIYYGHDEDGNIIYQYKDESGNLQFAELDTENYYEIPSIGPIDHQSIGILQGFLREKNITVEEFLINKRYIVIINDDNSQLWQEYKKSGIIDLDFIEEEYPPDNYPYDFHLWMKEKENEEDKI